MSSMQLAPRGGDAVATALLSSSGRFGSSGGSLHAGDAATRSPAPHPAAGGLLAAGVTGDLPVVAERLARENAVLKADVDRLTAVATGLETECNHVRARAVDAEARNRSLQRQVAALESESEVMRSEIASKHSR
jgi:hypothetical protein